MPQLLSHKLLSKMSLDWQLRTPIFKMSVHVEKEMHDPGVDAVVRTHGGGGGDV